jgi:DNA ligase-associated metallophosphoesterase
MSHTSSRRTAAASVTHHAGGERVQLYADRALYWPAGRTLFVADVHLGKTAAFRAGGVALPGGATAANLERLARLVAATRAEALVVLGDFLHAAAGRTDALGREFDAWRAAHRELAITLVRGNHDDHAGDPPPSWRVEVVDEPEAAPPFLLCHAPPEAHAGGLFGYALAGHVHPAVLITGAGLQSERLPCFVLGKHRAILPAFGRFTGSAVQAWARDDAIVAIAGDRLFGVPRS